MQEKNVMDWYTDVLRQYTVFTGRAGRQEFWMFALINFGIMIAISVVENVLGLGILSFVYSLAVFLPSLAVTIRRLHDTDRIGWWSLVALIPLVGWIILLVLMALPGTPGPNRYGPPPAGAPAAP